MKLADLAQHFDATRLPVIYISGPMSGIEEFNFPAFRTAARRLRSAGFPVLDPSDFGADEKTPYNQILGRDLALVAHADVVVVLPGYQNSKGAGLEIDVALALGIPICEAGDVGPKLLALFFDGDEIETLCLAAVYADAVYEEVLHIHEYGGSVVRVELISEGFRGEVADVEAAAVADAA